MRGVLGPILIILFVWSSMIVGLGVIFKGILLITIPIDGLLGRILTSTVHVGLSIFLAILWLWTWKKIEYTYFWRTLKRQKRE